MTIHVDVVELLGILGTLFILISFTRNRSAEIRVINSIGSILFVIYGLKLGALSVWLLNGICILVNIYKLWGDYRRWNLHKGFIQEKETEILTEFDKLMKPPDIDTHRFKIKKKTLR